MKLYHGTHRSVLQVGPIVIKVPRLKFFKYLVQRKYRPDRRYIMLLIRESISENHDEWQTWRDNREWFLAKVYFSWGPILIQRYINGRPATDEEVSVICAKIAWATGGAIYQTNAHVFDTPQNYRLTPQGFILIDYGSGKKMAMSEFLGRWHSELSRILAR